MAETASRIDPALLPYLQTGLQRAQELFLTGPQPTFFPRQTFVSPSEQTLAALTQQEQAATAAAPILGAAQQAYTSALGATTGARPLFEQIYGGAGIRPGVSVFEQAAAGRLAPTPTRFEELYKASGSQVPSLYGDVAQGRRAIPTDFLSGLAQQAAQQPAAGLYGQVAGGEFQNLALPGTAQVAGGGFLAGSPYQQAMISAATRPLVQQYAEQVVPGIASGFSRAGRYGSGAMQQAQSRAAESFARGLGDVTAGIVGQEYARERGFQEAARQQLGALSQQDLANRLAAAGALQSSQQSAIAQQAGLFGQQTGLQQQNLANQLQAAQIGEATRQAQLAQQAGLAGQLAGLQQQGVATQLAGAGGLEQAQQAALSTQLAAAGGLGTVGGQEIARQAALAQAAPSFFQMGFLPSQALAQVGAAREQIAAQPLQEEIARFNFEQQVPRQSLQTFLSSVYGSPMAASQYAPIPQAQTNRLGQAIGGAGLGYLAGQTFGFNPVYGAIGGGLLGGLF